MAVSFSLLFQPNTLPPQSPSNPCNHFQIKILTNMFVFLPWASAAQAMQCLSQYLRIKCRPGQRGPFVCVYTVCTWSSVWSGSGTAATQITHISILESDSITQPYLSANSTWQMGTCSDFWALPVLSGNLDIRISCAPYLLNINHTFCSDLSTSSGWNTTQAVVFRSVYMSMI